MNIKKELQQYKNEHQPTIAQTDRIFLKVFQQLPTSEKNTIMKKFITHHKIISGAIGTFALALIIVLPLALNTSLVKQNTNKTNVSSTLGLQQSDSYSDKEKSYNINPKADSTNSGTYRNEDTKTAETSRAKVQTAIITYETNNVSEQYQKITDFAAAVNGYIDSTDFSGGDKQKAKIVMRIPANKFNETLSKIRELKMKVISESISTYDQQNQLTENQKQMDSYTQQLKDLEQKLATETNAANKTTIQNQINTVKNQISYYSQQIQTIKVQTDFSTITVNLNQAEKPTEVPNTWNSLGKSLETIATFWIQAIAWAIVPILIIALAYFYCTTKNN